MEQKLSVSSFQRITLQMTSHLNIQDVLVSITQGLVDELDAAFARIWLLGTSDLCADCNNVNICSKQGQCLHLKASAGIYTRTNGEYRRVPLGALKIGVIGQTREPLSTNDVLNDDRLPNKKWLRENKFQSFAGHPLIFQGELLGVIAMFSRQVIATAEFDRIAVFANQAAIAIKNAQLFTEIIKLKNRLQAENVYLQDEIKLDYNFDEIITKSLSFKKVLHNVEQVAKTDSTVLISGETGTGKELIARAIHKTSLRNQRPLVKVNCAALPANLIESELFGHEKGAFTGAISKRIGRFELADRGTIFLDEIGDLPQDMQVKLLRVLQEGEFERLGSQVTIKVDTRVIAATNRNIEKLIRDGSFREDLFFRLNVFPIHLPPLRARREDIPMLVRHFIKKYNIKLGKQIDSIPKNILDVLQSYDWPGNVRELENILERAMIISRGRTLKLGDWFKKSTLMTEPQQPLKLKEMEKQHIEHILSYTKWRVRGRDGAAEILGIKPTTLEARMKKLGICR